MVTSKIKGVQFIAANTDADALSSSLADIKFNLVRRINERARFRRNPDIGRRAAEESIGRWRKYSEELTWFLSRLEWEKARVPAFLLLSQMPNNWGYSRWGCNKTFMWEGKLKMSIAEEGIKALKPHTDVR